MNLFLIIQSRYELSGFMKVLSEITRLLFPINVQNDFALRATFTESLDALAEYKEMIETKNDSDIFPCVLAFHSDLTDILPQRIEAITKEPNPKASIEFIIFIEEINRQLKNPDYELEAKILIHDFIKENQVVDSE